MADQFKERAGGWDEIPWKIDLARDAYNAICGKVKIRKDTRLLDFGGGTGLLTLKFTNRVSRITVVDTSAAMLGVLREKIKAQAIDNIEIIDEALSEGMLPTRSCDLIISMMTLHHIEDLAALFHIFFDTLEAGGNIALIDLASEEGDFHPKGVEYVHDGFEPEALITPLEKVGFRNMEVEVFTTIARKTDSGDTKNYPLLIVTAET